jgi:hypothetical protein
MKVTFGDKKPLSQCYSVPAEGQFALEAEGEKSLHWDHCREQFLGKFKEGIPGFYFSHKADRGVNIAGFVLKFEEVVGAELKSLSFSHFSETGRETVLWVEPSGFWRSCLLKKSLLTLLLRCGSNYDNVRDNFDDALFGPEYNENKYARETKNAIMRFLFGFTKFSGTLNQTVPVQTMGTTSTLIRHGWHAEFDKNTIYDVRRKLIRPSDESHEVSLVGAESLWG